MSPSLNPRKSLAYVLMVSLIITGSLTFATRQSHAFNSSLPHAFTPSVNESSEKAVPQAKAVDEATRSRVHEALGKMPLSFEENRGQVNSEVRYISRGAGYTLFLTETEAVLTLRNADFGMRNKNDGARHARHRQSSIVNRSSAVLRMKLSGANNAPTITSESKLGVKTNYFKGNDPQQWHTGVARYERVRYAQVYPGIDTIYYGEQQQLEYDFEVAPFADARRIALEFTGVKRVRVERRTGDLVLKTVGGEVRQRRPVAYQEVGGKRRAVASRYVVEGQRKVRIEVGEYDRRQRLVIDPVLSYSTYLGGANENDFGSAIAVDSAGIVYVTGFTQSRSFPTLNQYQTSLDDYGYYTSDAFVAKLDTKASGTAALLYSTYLGGHGGDLGTGIAVDSAGNVYVTGYTYSNDFPTLHPYQRDQGEVDIFM
ncbi:MAG: SBBP repeat-containing protein, partial [Pyrinomonadaceae bacterium]|nr:SBBP repeat-containing protein [Pyrinomonadaceae bacterium]